MSNEDYNRSTLIVEIGGFLWWLLVRFCKTDLEKEQAERYNARNVFFICIVIMIGFFVKVKFFE